MGEMKDARDARIATLEGQLEKALTLVAVVEELRAEIVVLKARIVELEARVGRNSSNSSKPPSTNGPGFVARKKGKSALSKGGQIGHEGHHRTLVPEEQMSHIQDYKPTTCQGCGAGLVGEDESPWRHQVSELPELKAHITEHRTHALRCPCGVVTRGTLPAQIASSQFGPKVTAMVAVLAGGFRLSHQNIEGFLADSFAVTIAASSITTLERRVSAAIAAPVAEAKARLQASDAVHCDETSWLQNGSRHWLWILANQRLCILTIEEKRDTASIKVLQE